LTRGQRRHEGGNAAFKSVGRGLAGDGDDAYDNDDDDDDQLWLDPSRAAVRPRVVGMAFGAGYRYRSLQHVACLEYRCDIVLLGVHLLVFSFSILIRFSLCFVMFWHFAFI
jgi:hypothetical protein